MCDKPVARTSKSGSQFDEDLVLKDVLGLTPVGTYVEVGLYEPEDGSNTWNLYWAGWKGLLIEPVDYHWEEILRRRPRDHLWPAAAGNFCGVAPMNMHRQRSSFKHRRDETDEVRNVQVDTLKSILDRFPEIRDECRLCSIDVEGWERQVLEGIDWSTFHPDALVIEYVSWPEHGSKDVSGEWIHLVTGEGYKEVWRNKVNLIFAAEGS